MNNFSLPGEYFNSFDISKVVSSASWKLSFFINHIFNNKLQGMSIVVSKNGSRLLGCDLSCYPRPDVSLVTWQHLFLQFLSVKFMRIKISPIHGTTVSVHMFGTRWRPINSSWRFNSPSTHLKHTTNCSLSELSMTSSAMIV